MALFQNSERWLGWISGPMTPFTKNGELDRELYIRHVEWIVASGAPAICPLMHVGENLNLTIAERKDIAAWTVESVAGRVPVSIHVSSASTVTAVDLARHAESIGADAITVATPYYWAPNDEGQFLHFQKVAGAFSRSVIAYNSPGLIGVGISPQLLARMISEIPNLWGLKEASHHQPTFMRLLEVVQRLRPDFSVLTGLDYMFLNKMAGGAGSHSGVFLIAPNLIHQLWKATCTGDYETAIVLQQRVARLLNLMTDPQYVYPAGFKESVRLVGRSLGTTRLPHPPLTKSQLSKMAAGFEAEGLYETEPFGWDVSAAPNPDLARREVADFLAS